MKFEKIWEKFESTGLDQHSKIPYLNHSHNV